MWKSKCPENGNVRSLIRNVQYVLINMLKSCLIWSNYLIKVNKFKQKVNRVSRHEPLGGRNQKACEEKESNLKYITENLFAFNYF